MILSFDKDGFIDNATCPWCVAPFTILNKGPFAMYCANCGLTYYRNFDYRSVVRKPRPSGRG